MFLNETKRINYILKLLTAAALASFFIIPSTALAERVSLTGLQTQINNVESQVQEVENTVCGTADAATCSLEMSPSVRERILALETEKAELLASLCLLAAQTGNNLPVCGPIEGDLRIVAGAAANEGRLELFFNSQWGTVCDDRWDINDATVACRQLGYAGADAALYTSNVVSGTGPINLDDVQCIGSETRLLDCTSRLPGTHNCSHFEDAGVRCTLAP
jgi:hypothetical protein